MSEGTYIPSQATAPTRSRLMQAHEILLEALMTNAEPVVIALAQRRWDDALSDYTQAVADDALVGYSVKM